MKEYSQEELEQLEKMRHSASHVLADAVIRYFAKEDGHVKLGIGPAIRDGFYYDFELPRKINDTDLRKIEKIMKRIKQENHEFEKRMIPREDAINLLAERGQIYKVELATDLEDEELSFFRSGEFDDLCRGPHVEKTGDIGEFRLMSVAGAYWRGDESRPMLTRIYGVAFNTKEELADHMEWLEEVKKRDHRKLGKELDLFTFSDLVGPGLPLFTPKGNVLRREIQDAIYDLQKKYNYQEVWIPHITKKELYETSGHWTKFKDDLFHVKGRSDTQFVMKPMNCPHHTQIYASKLRSYRDLPIRYIETTTNYRDEQVGELHGLSRVRSLTQDDGHIFCTIEQVKEEASNIVNVVKDFYKALGMFEEGKYWVSLSVRDPENLDNYLGKEENWELAEQMLKEVAEEGKLNFKRVEGEAAFYGPKLDFMFNDALGRQNQLATIQIDFAMPERFGLEYTTSEGKKETPVMIHRAIAGSLERFLSIMIEHFGGKFPLWLSPVQVIIVPIGEKHNEYALDFAETLKEAGIRVEVDTRDERMQAKIRDAQLQKVNYMLIIGDKEVETGGAAVRPRDGKDLGLMSADSLVEKLKKEIEDRA